MKRRTTNKPWLAQNHNSKFARYRRAALQLLGPWNVAKCPPYRQGQALEQDQQGSRRVLLETMEAKREIREVLLRSRAATFATRGAEHLDILDEVHEDFDMPC